jgi:putative sigma-54 modulation protein
MRYTIVGKNIEVTNALRDVTISKFSKLEKYFTPDTEAQITMSVLKQKHIIEVTIPIKGSVIRAEEDDENMYAAVDEVLDVLERQILKHKKKLVTRHRHHGHFRDTFIEEEHDEDEGIVIKRSKRFAMKPMDAEEACMEMELLNHDFFVFRNSETEEVNVVYKRKDGKFGLIEPEI